MLLLALTLHLISAVLSPSLPLLSVTQTGEETTVGVTSPHSMANATGSFAAVKGGFVAENPHPLKARPCADLPLGLSQGSSPFP